MPTREKNMDVTEESKTVEFEPQKDNIYYSFPPDFFNKEITLTCKNFEFFPGCKPKKKIKLFKKFFGIDASRLEFPKKKDRRTKRLKRRMSNG